MIEKRCVSCRSEKPIDDFNRNKSKNDGRADACRPCMKAYLKEWGDRNRERKRQMDREYASNNRERAKEKTRQWISENRDRKRKNDRDYQQTNRLLISAQSAKYRAENREKILAQKKKYAAENRERLRADQKAWKQANKGKVLANVTLRKMKKRKATPPWLTKEQRLQMRQAYDLAEIYSQCLGEPYEVDHIIPISHPSVCGLHVPWNLQVITARANRGKSNKFES